MSKRLLTDAKIALQKSGYIVKEVPGRNWMKPIGLVVYKGKEESPWTWTEIERLAGNHGTVSNFVVERLLQDSKNG